MEEAAVKAAILLQKTTGDIVLKTLDTLISASEAEINKLEVFAKRSEVQQSYEFNKTLLSATYEGRGAVVNRKG